MDVSGCEVVIDRAPLYLFEVIPILTLCWKLLNHSNQVKLQDTVFEFERWWLLLQKLFLCLKNFYMMYVKYLDGLFGHNLQGVRG